LRVQGETRRSSHHGMQTTLASSHLSGSPQKHFHKETRTPKTMQAIGRSLILLALVVLAVDLSPAKAMTAAEIDREVQKILDKLYEPNAKAHHTTTIRPVLQWQ